MNRSWSGAGLLDYPQVSLDDLSEPPPPHHTDSQPSTTRAARATVSAAALSRAEVASEKKKQPKMNAWQDAARDRAQSRRTGAALGTRGPSLPTNRPRKKVEASPLALLELPGLKLKLGAPAPAAHRLGLKHPRAPPRTPGLPTSTLTPNPRCDGHGRRRQGGPGGGEGARARGAPLAGAPALLAGARQPAGCVGATR